MAYIITNKLVDRTNLSEDVVQKVLDALRDVIIEEVAVGETVSVRGLLAAKPISYKQLTKSGVVDGFTTKIVPSKSLTDTIEKASLNPSNLSKAKENIINMEEAMREAGISIMEIPALN